jgi:hypothetical protein
MPSDPKLSTPAKPVLPNLAPPVKRSDVLEPWTTIDIYHRGYLPTTDVMYRAGYMFLDFVQLMNGVNINDPQYFMSASADRLRTMSSCAYSPYFCGYSPFRF